MDTKQTRPKVYVVGNGMTHFLKPGKHPYDYPELANIAMKRACRDANIKFDQIQQAYAGYVYGDSASGQRAIYTMGNTGIPIVNVNNNCSTGSTALYMAHQAITGGHADCVLALGFDKMFTGSLKSFFDDRSNPLEKFTEKDIELRGQSKNPMAPRLFGNAGLEHIQKYGTKVEHFAKIAEKNHRHSVNNPYSQFKDVYTLDQIMNSPKIHYPLTKLQCCPTSDGAAAAIIASESFVKKHNLENQAVEIIGISLKTDYKSTFSKSSMDLVGSAMSKACAQDAFKQAGITPNDVQVCELHDCFSANELITYEALGLCDEGKAGQAIDNNQFTYGGKVVVNPSGGLISKGHPLGATGLAQCAELCWQIRGMAEQRQVKHVKYALQHNLGLGGACVVTIYKKMNNAKGWSRADQSSDPAVLEQYEKDDIELGKPKL